MGNMDGRLGNATPTASSHQLHLWKSPRWIVNRIEALAVLAIIISFFLAVFGSCRRWSNRWIIQKGFLAAQVLSLSIGTYSIGLMQSSSAKSEMYPVWTVSLFTLFGCIDPVTTYNGLDYKGPLSKVVYGICLNCGYVLLMSISTISNAVGNTAIMALSVVTFVKGFHRSFALVQQNRMQDMKKYCSPADDSDREKCVLKKDEPLSSDDKRFRILVYPDSGVLEGDIEASVRNNSDKRLRSCYDACVALCLSHKLQRHILGLDFRVPRPETLKGIDFKWALKVVEMELALVYDAFFTGNPFFHYHQAKTASVWALVSFTGTCFVLVATAIPGIMTSRWSGAGCTKVVDTTTADRAITFGILGSLVVLQLTQLAGSWTSNWARAAVACAYAREDDRRRARPEDPRGTYKMSGWMRLKLFVATSTGNLFDSYRWQDKMSQYSMLPEPRLFVGGKIERELLLDGEIRGEWIRRRCVDLVQALGLHYIWQVIWELLSSDSNKRDGVKLDEDVKGSVMDFLGQIKSDRLDRNWLSSLPKHKGLHHFLAHFNEPRPLLHTKPEVHCYRYASCVMTWHIVTWFCEVAEQSSEAEDDDDEEEEETAPAGYCYYLRKAAAAIPIRRYWYYLRRKAAAAIRRALSYLQRIVGGGGRRRRRRNASHAHARDHRRVANALSMYCAYLVKSAPELLPGPVALTTRVYDRFAEEVEETGMIDGHDKDTIFADMPDRVVFKKWYAMDRSSLDFFDDHRVNNAKALANLLLLNRRRHDVWKILARVWVQLLVYAAPYGNAEAHMRRLSQGGEFITHLWALLYHLEIREWKVEGNLAQITTVEDAQRVLADEGSQAAAVVAYVGPQYDYFDPDELATASRLEGRVKYYYTSEPDVASLFMIDYQVGRVLVFMKKEASINHNHHNFTFYDGELRAYYIARFVTDNMIALDRRRDQPQAQSSQDDGRRQSEAGIQEEEIQTCHD